MLNGDIHITMAVMGKEVKIMINGISGYDSSMQLQYLQAQQQPRRPNPQDILAMIDSNQDGSIDKVEFSAFAKKMQDKIEKTPGVDQFFKNNDTNGDNLISKEEMLAGMEKMLTSGGGRPPGGPGGIGGPGGGSGKTEESSSTTSIDPADTNGDGTVSLSEYIAYMATKSTDTNGKVDPKELIAKLATSVDNVLKAYAAGSYGNSATSSTFSSVA
jgi:Ca2+-binding EF-hand superfamily protein